MANKEYVVCQYLAKMISCLHYLLVGTWYKGAWIFQIAGNIPDQAFLLYLAFDFWPVVTNIYADWTDPVAFVWHMLEKTKLVPCCQISFWPWRENVLFGFLVGLRLSPEKRPALPAAAAHKTHQSNLLRAEVPWEKLRTLFIHWCAACTSRSVARKQEWWNWNRLTFMAGIYDFAHTGTHAPHEWK